MGGPGRPRHRQCIVLAFGIPSRQRSKPALIHGRICRAELDGQRKPDARQFYISRDCLITAGFTMTARLFYYMARSAFGLPQSSLFPVSLPQSRVTGPSKPNSLGQQSANVEHQRGAPTWSTNVEHQRGAPHQAVTGEQTHSPLLGPQHHQPPRESTGKHPPHVGGRLLQ
jgi:hypothetical protein